MARERGERAPRCRLAQYRVPGTWDQGVDWEEARACLRRLLRWARRRRPRAYPYLAVLAIQAANGARVMEAARVYALFLESRGREREYRLQAEKHGNTRLFIVPREVEYRREDEWFLLELQRDPERVRKRLRDYARYYLGARTHALRSATITYMSGKGVTPQEIAKALGYKTLDTIIKYIQIKRGEEVLREIAGG